jgi:hypothetical protein
MHSLDTLPDTLRETKLPICHLTLPQFCRNVAHRGAAACRGWEGAFSRLGRVAALVRSSGEAMRRHAGRSLLLLAALWPATGSAVLAASEEGGTEIGYVYVPRSSAGNSPATGAERSPADGLVLPPVDWSAAARAEHVVDPHQIDLARDVDRVLDLRPRLSPGELMAQAEEFEHSSLALSGPSRHHSAGSQFSALGKDLGLRLGDAGLGNLLERLETWYERRQ